MLIKKLTAEPYRGDKEVAYGKKTKVNLFEDRLDYDIDYEYESEVAIQADESIKFTTKMKEKGSIYRTCIDGISQSIENLVDKEEEDEILNKKGGVKVTYLHMVSVIYNGSYINIRCKDEEEREKLYTEIYNWLHNIKDENN